VNGVIAVLKPPGMSSGGVVGFMKHATGERHIGHAGTLDPGAAGVLVVLAGKSTRLSDYMMGSRKTYIAEVTFGMMTDTLDSYGVVTERKEGVNVTAEQLESVLAEFTGEVWQTPPAYSAVSVNGQRSYKLARKGIEVAKPPRKIEVYENKLLHQTGENSFLIEVSCSKGTYIRTLAADIGAKLGAPAYLSFLLRTKSGGISIDRAYTLDEISAMSEAGDFSYLMCPDEAYELPKVNLSAEKRDYIKNGRAVEYEGELPEMFWVYCEDMLCGIGERAEDGIRLKARLEEI